LVKYCGIVLDRPAIQLRFTFNRHPHLNYFVIIKKIKKSLKNKYKRILLLMDGRVSEKDKVPD
jgi:hypothetical protein